MKYLYYSIIFFGLVLLFGVLNLSKLNKTVNQIISQPESNQVNTQDNQNGDYQTVLKKISELEQEILNLKLQLELKTPINTNLTNLSKPTPFISSSLNMLEIADPNWQTIDVFEKPLASSKVVGQANYGTIYFYESKQQGWYQIHLDLENLGWIQQQFVKELP